MRKKEFLITLILVVMLSVAFVQALSTSIDQSRQQRLDFDHLLYISDIITYPTALAPGQVGILNFKIENMGNQFIKDVRIDLTLPAELAPSNDITKRKIAYMDSGAVENVSFNIVPLPTTDDGIYKIPITINYLNWIGDEREENDTMSLVVGSNPQILAELSSSEIYSGNRLGNVKIKVINDNPGNVKFLKVQLSPSENYEIIGSSLEYVGDLNSDDFSDVSFKIKLGFGVDSTELPIVLTYKDALNKDYYELILVPFKVPSAAEAGIKKSYAGVYIVLAIIAIGAFIAYRRYKKKLVKLKKGAMLSISSKF